ncbi:MAG: hypothetical protein Q3961_01665 [Bifidobacteriaceae bacterium]|nr:hypothetical protein [Bifidobacteriaceae bacterium]
MPYDASRRTSREYHRVVRKGTERFNVEGDEFLSMDRSTQDSRDNDDDRRILDEIPPHWFIHNKTKSEQ